jgi:O-acetyl-ADP-ribose deacetylase (regulator of RNase III)
MTKSEYSYKDVKIIVEKGDITKLEVDAIVNAANSMLIMGGGVAGAILRRGGREIQEEALKYAPVPVGKAVATKAGKLKTEYVIHAPTMERPAMRIGRENVRLATKGALECAEQLKIGSVAFPGMGTGVGGLKPEEAAEVMVQEIKKCIDRGTTLKQIILVGFTEDLSQAFQNALRTSML